MYSKIKLVMFDLDGVLFDSKHNMKISWNAVSKKFYLKIEFKKYFKNVGLPFQKILRNLGIKSNFKNIENYYQKKSIENFSKIKIYPNIKKTINYYSNSWWLAQVLNKEIIYARGFLGQYIVIIPDINLVFVRLGKNENPRSAFKNEYMLTDNLKFFIEQIIHDFSTL